MLFRENTIGGDKEGASTLKKIRMKKLRSRQGNEGMGRKGDALGPEREEKRREWGEGGKSTSTRQKRECLSELDTK